MAQAHKEKGCPICGGPIDQTTGKCKVCGGFDQSKHKKVGKKVQAPIGKPASPKERDEAGAEPPLPDDNVAPDQKGEKALGAKPPQTPPGKSTDESLAKWLAGDGSSSDLAVWMGTGKDKPKTVAPQAKQPEAADGSMDALKKWLSGEEDTLADWLGTPPDKAKAAPSKVKTKEDLEKEKSLSEREKSIQKKEEELEGLRAEYEELKKSMAETVKKVELGNFDPINVLEETARLNKELQSEIKKRKKLEDEIEQVKKGSISVIKYVKAQQVSEKSGAAKSLKKKLDEEVAKREKLEAEVKKKEEIMASLKEEMNKGLDKLPADAKNLKKRELEMLEKEKGLKAKEEELASKETQMRQKASNGSVASEASLELQQKIVAELSAKERDFIDKEAKLKEKILELEEKLHAAEIDQKLQKETTELKGKSEGEINADLDRKARELQVKEKSLLVREDEIRRLKEQLKSKEEEIKTLKEPLAYKEDEMLRREEDLVYREKMLMEERKKLEEAIRESGSMETHEMKKKLEELQLQINKKEDEVRTKENYLRVKMEELKLREKGLIEEEISAREEDRSLELKIEKVKTGDRRLDDLMLGGIPFGTNVLIYGPPFTGKEVTINSFVGEGLKKGVPAIYVITEKLPAEIREEMMFVVSGFEEYERLGLVRFVDAYSKSIGVEEEEPNVVYVADSTDHQAIMKAVDQIAKELMKKHKYYRLAFRSISTLIAYMDSGTAFKFLQPFCGRRKRDRSVAMYAIEKGMHDEQDIQMIGSVMDGMIDYKVEQLKTFLSIRGIGDVQSRAWIDYTYSKQGLAIGSFSLDHIR